MKQTKAEKLLDKAIEQEYYKQANGLQINIMDMPKLFSLARTEVASGSSVEEAVKNGVSKFCIKR